LWKQIFALNRDNVAAALELYERKLAELRTAIQRDDQTALKNLLAAAKKNRDALGS
jgi:prephenate dehydrogenase